MMKHKLFQFLNICVFFLASPVGFAGGLQELEDVTVRVIELNELPGANIPLIELPEPDLGELHDNLEGAKLPGHSVLQHQPAGDFARAGPLEGGADAVADIPEQTSVPETADP